MASMAANEGKKEQDNFTVTVEIGANLKSILNKAIDKAYANSESISNVIKAIDIKGIVEKSIRK